jgi:hypothetical protein
MTKADTESFVRLGIGLALSVCMWPLIKAGAGWSSYERETRIALISGSMAAAAIVTLVPLFWRGKPWQAPVAFVLLWMPILAVRGVILTLVHQL